MVIFAHAVTRTLPAGDLEYHQGRVGAMQAAFDYIIIDLIWNKHAGSISNSCTADSKALEPFGTRGTPADC
jgi:hypothetical protein